jgi:site-specific recombinase XerD
MSPASLASALQRFFTERLLGQLGASPHTVASYRDAFRLLLRFLSERLNRAPSEMRLEELDAPTLQKFLEHLESQRQNSIRTRNTRLSALRAFFRFVSLSEPALALHCQRVLAMPAKRYERGPVEFLDEQEAIALVATPDLRTWVGRRDRALLLTAIQTGLRNSELTSLRCEDVQLGMGAHVRCMGKGRKMRCTPLRPDVSSVLKEWISEQAGKPGEPVFPSSRGGRLSADAFQRLVLKYVSRAVHTCPSLREKSVTPHTLRHAAAMCLLRHGVDLSIIALWLGHESVETTQIYLHADMKLKEQALARTKASGAKPQRYRPPDPLLAYLESL